MTGRVVFFEVNSAFRFQSDDESYVEEQFVFISGDISLLSVDCKALSH